MYMNNGNGYPYYYGQNVPGYYQVNQVPMNYYVQVNQPMYVQQTRPTVQQVLQTIRSEHSNLYTQMERAGVSRQLTEALFFFVVNYTINQANPNQSANQIYRLFQRDTPWINILIESLNLPLETIDRYIN